LAGLRPYDGAGYEFNGAQRRNEFGVAQQPREKLAEGHENGRAAAV
jgi:hypothetical protein